MFMGEFKHSIDAKGRLTIPSKIRNQCQGSVYVARGFDGCLAFYTKEEWDPFCAKLLSLPSNKKEVRKAIRFTISSACECEFDKLGNHGEIWSQEKWNQYYNDNQDSYDDILESLDDFSL